MYTLKNKKIAIVGGGPGGLTLARLLQMKGVEVKVYERDINKYARMQGATLDLHEESGLAALQEAGLMPAFKANYRPGAERLCIMDNHARVVFKEEPALEEDISRPEIDRGPLQRILLDSLEPDTVMRNSHFEALIPQGDSWKLTFKNGVAALADIVIAADGARSKVRPYITPIKPFYTGMTALEGTVYHAATASPGIHKLLDGGKIFAMDNERSLIVSSKGDGSLVFYTCCKTDESWNRGIGIDFSDKAQVLDWFKAEFAGWDHLFQELLENVTTPFVPRPLYCMPLDQTWQPLKNLTMLGDAAHLMPPFAGEGVNMAMLDALELSKCLTSEDYPGIQEAIAAYEASMRQRAARAALESMESMKALHAPGAIDFLLGVVS
ncbi:MAG TPA: NAD(P)/FAD-dependent oxidoreductase [Puia sp.]|nr:NAD(P)/FAD-dependent oxidoreductase [Puia sp.]